MSNFETWWEREGQEFLFALNTTTDDDIKLVAEIAWKNGAYCAEQQEQEPVAWMWACTECGTEAEDGIDCRICSSCGYHKFYKAPKVATCVCAAKTQEKVKQEPVALSEMRRIAAEYVESDSHVDSGNLFWALCGALQYIDAELKFNAPVDAKAIRADALEEAAKVCESKLPYQEEYDFQKASGNTARACAAAIRARGKK